MAMVLIKKVLMRILKNVLMAEEIPEEEEFFGYCAKYS